MPQQFIDFAYVKENASFEPVIARYNLKLIGTGASRRVLCPFHRERNPSCSIDLARKIFQCFGCQAKGNILEFVARMEGDEGDLRAAAMKIAEICGIGTAAPRERGSIGDRGEGNAQRARRDERGKNHEAEPAARPVPENGTARVARHASGNARDALTNRQVHGAARSGVGARRRRIERDWKELHGDAGGFAGALPQPVNPPLTFQLKLDPSHPYLAKRGLSAELVEAFGLGYSSRGSMAGRICIPIHNERGELVAYAGRWPGEDLPEGQERYRLPKNFEKSRVLFNLHRVADTEHIVLVEGYWSVIRLHALGVPVAALMGWSASEGQVALLRDRGTRFVTLLLDGDEAGRRAREKTLPALASAFFTYGPELPEGEKPDTLPETQLLQLVRFPTP